MLVMNEKDYFMKVIREMVNVFISLVTGKSYNDLDQEAVDQYTIGDKSLAQYKKMVDDGLVEEARDEIATKIDYSDRDQVVAAAEFYQYVAHNASYEDSQIVKDDIIDLANNTGYGSLLGILVDYNNL